MGVIREKYSPGAPITTGIRYMITRRVDQTRPSEEGSYAISGENERTMRKKKEYGRTIGRGKQGCPRKEFTYLSAINNDKGMEKRINADLKVVNPKRGTS